MFLISISGSQYGVTEKFTDACAIIETRQDNFIFLMSMTWKVLVFFLSLIELVWLDGAIGTNANATLPGTPGNAKSNSQSISVKTNTIQTQVWLAYQRYCT